MSSPFSIFRRYEKMMMVGVTGIAIVSFVLLGAVQQVQDIPPSMMVLVVAAVLAVIGALAGLSNGKSGEWGLSGALIGVIIGFVGMMFSGERVVVGMDKGSLTQKKFEELQRKRSIANGFMHMAIQHSFGEQLPPVIYQQFLFDFTQGSQDEVRELVFGEILRREGDEIGLTIPKQTVVDFIKDRFSQQGLASAMQNVMPGLSQQEQFMLQFALMNVKPKPISSEAFTKIRNQLRVSESELIDAIGSELKAIRAFGLLQANNQVTPEMFWDYFQKLNVKTDVDIAVIPVADFEDLQATPPELEIQELFNKYNRNSPGFTSTGEPAPGSPGFMLPRRVQLSYVEIAPENVAALLDEVTDEEVEARYRERFQQDLPASDGPELPGTDSLDTPDAVIIEEEAIETEAPAEAVPEAAPAVEGSTSQTFDVPATQTVALLQDESAPVVGEIPVPATEQPASEEGVVPGEIPVPPSADVPEAPSMELPPVPSDEIPDAPTSDAPELNDDLREEIRETIRSERAREAVRKKSEDVYHQLNDILSRVRINVINEQYKNQPEFSPDPTGITVEAGQKEIEEYVAANGLRLITTPFVSYQDLRESEDYGVGTAFNRTAVANLGQVPAADNLFMTSPTSTYIPYTAVQFTSGTEFIYWKFEDKAPYVPNRIDEEPEIRDLVVKAWRRLQAAPKAEARANQLAKIVTDSEKTAIEALETETVTGQEGDLFLNVRQLNSFTWMNRPMVPQTSLSQDTTVSPSLVEGVENPGELFYNTVFRTLKAGETKVIPNADHTEYLVVKLAHKDPATPEAYDALRQQFLTQGMMPAYRTMAVNDLARVRVNFQQELYDSYNVDIRSETDQILGNQ